MQQPVQSNIEGSVTAGFILSIFEVMVGENTASKSYPWLQHANGTVALLNSIWPHSRVPNDETKALLDVSYTSLLASLISERPVPRMFFHLEENCGPVGGYTTSDHPFLLSIRLCSIMSNLVNLYVSMKNTSKYPQAQLLASAIASDQALAAWVVSLPSSWAFTTSGHGSHKDYGSPWFARTWNYYRLSRILAQKLIFYGLNTVSISLNTMDTTLIDKYKLQVWIIDIKELELKKDYYQD
ncbi:fungal transcriptional regulatory n-terminal [Fusarium heterosporum]|uniref:Fungal transcriptional regulatory n-terminal n=1 Tax=Fusarium heterosporum TaxID=42747 RepID=A0A8H5SM68_FUSHE|nr:fungal transcriptional regulatory n-terminal [Fusarium heterosporum]